VSGRRFDAQVVLSPKDSRRGQLLENYVRVRITDMTDVDIALYDYDRHFSIYFFAVSPDEQIYLRYGGRDARSADSYLDLDSLVLALEAGLEQHQRWERGALPRADRPAPKFPRDIDLLRREEMTADNEPVGRCIECHMISDYQVVAKEAAGTLDKPRDIFRSPDIRNIGIHLDVPRGLVVAEATGAAAAAGMLAGDAIVAIESTPVLTFGDFLYLYDKVDRSASELALSVERGGRRVDLELELPPLWWVQDLKYRRWSVDPVVDFDSVPLTPARRAELGLDPKGVACEVTDVRHWAAVLDYHTLEPGDVIVSVDGVETDPVATSCRLYIQLRVRAGESVTLGIIRKGERMDTVLNTQRKHFRKSLRSRMGR
jgi:hypothetical protein